MSASIASSDMWKLAGLTTLGIGIMWALQMLGFGPSWIISAAAGAGASAGVVYIAASLRDETEGEAVAASGFPEIA